MMPSGHLTPTAQQGGTGAGNSGKTGGEHTAMNMGLLGAANTGAATARVLFEVAEMAKPYVDAEAIAALARNAFAIAERSAMTVLTIKPAPLPGLSNREPIPPSNRPE